MSRYKLAVIVRTDLGMSTGKIAVQVGHASVLAYKHDNTSACIPDDAQSCVCCKWLDEGQFKVVLRCPDSVKEYDDHTEFLGPTPVKQEGVLLYLVKKAREVGLPTVEVRDLAAAERDVFKPNTLTAIALGPALSSEVDKVTGELKLL